MYNKLLVIKENIIVEKEDDVYIVRNTESGKNVLYKCCWCFYFEKWE